MATRAAPVRTARFVPLTDEAAFSLLLERSRSEPVVLFKHDPYCGISMAAQQQVAEVDAEIAVVDVAAQRPLSLGIARQVGVRHESPQVIVFRDGRPDWFASHWAITTSALEAALRA